ncbi:molybdopterin-guanine dinucleotide biosynthesis protein B [Paramagnetospirillum marisnigri]|uniref:Molybdopterin-guanine dinucleotide biosynthesis protein B n=1 Tax=Paramagnetospirillum marisnigri TaxID=1285242 RepID=A0A178MQL9_9PROT|nr:molybdopterin-guanine dinucleotide biosynthesis protein B [Paramagnetospirillum marisnigri]OAN50244.1 molybdopterin-guanine dinucleotide biosynthesis protein B [Paramagnetospirillum marisnigri]
MAVFGVCGRSGSGKTTLLTRLIPWLKARGLTISTVKQAQEAFDVDKPGKDSYQHREAGAREVMIASARRWALMHEYRDQAEFSMEELLARMSPVDLVLVEGFRRWPHPRLEVWRAECGKPPFYPEDPLISAVASDAPVPGCPLPLLDLGDVAAIGAHILDRIGR